MASRVDIARAEAGVDAGAGAGLGLYPAPGQPSLSSNPAQGCAECYGSGVKYSCFDQYGVWIIPCPACGKSTAGSQWVLAAELGMIVALALAVVALV